MLMKREWKEFQNAGLFWWINRSLHLFGWCLVFEEEEDGTITSVYPATTSYRGFSPEVEAEGFAKLTDEIYFNIDAMRSEIALNQEQSDAPK